MRVLNLSHDNMFIERFSRYLETVAPGSGEYIVLSSNGNLRYVPVGSSVISVDTVDEARRLVKLNAEDVDFVIVHYMFPAWARLFPEISKKTRTVWSGYGGDYYFPEDRVESGLLAPLTAEVCRQTAPKLSMVGRIVRHRRQLLDERAKHRAAKSVDYFSAPISSDLEVFQRRYPDFRGEYRQINYGTVSESVAESPVIKGDDLLIGNSASYTNNHLDVFEHLRHTNLDGRKLVVPLSYGEPAEYRETVMRAGRAIFGSNFVPLVDLLPLSEYNQLISSCSLVVMGHRRQQGLGNIITALRSGCTVVLDRINPVYQEILGRGGYLRDLSALSVSDLGEIYLGPQEIAENQGLIESMWGESTVLGNLRYLLSSDASD